MIGKTHLVGGLAAASVICQAAYLPLTEGLIFTTGCAVGSLFPDIDHESSTVGKWVKPLSTLLHKRWDTEPFPLVLPLLPAGCDPAHVEARLGCGDDVRFDRRPHASVFGCSEPSGVQCSRG